ncbi:MAG TPA: ABC transporter permease [Chthoniobacterales bacterium]|jgi:predicted permease|nr:ABC transporter permease [Chthoniobacterales bacterium]
MISDLKHALRSLFKRPGFSITAVLTLALGLGASTAIFSVLDAVLLRPLPYPDQERIVELRELDEKGRGMSFAEPNFNDLAARNRSFEAVAKYSAFPEAIAGGSEPVRGNVCAVSTDFFRVLGVQPALGRVFASSDPADTKEAVVVSEGFWRRYLGGRPDLEGASIRFANRSFAVIGVVAADLEFPPATNVWFRSDVWPPNTSRTAHNWRAAGRLKPGVSLDQARADIAAVGRQLKIEHGSLTDAASFGLTPLRERFVKDLRGVLVVVCIAVGVLLTIACSNVANLLLVRATARRQEIAVRAALGASRWRLARQFLVETLLVTLGAGAIGVLFAIWGVDLVVGGYQGNLPRVGQIGVNATALGFALAVSLLTGILLGVIPVLSASHEQLQADLQSGGRGKSASRGSTRFRNLLIVAQVGLTLVLLVGAGLLGRSFLRLMEVNPGFQTESAVAMTVSMPGAQEPAEQRRLAQFYQQLLERLQNIPGVIAVGGINALPMSGDGANGTFIIEDGANPPQTIPALIEQLNALRGSNKTGDADFRVSSAGYFNAMSIPLLRGRLFQETDGPDGAHAAVISDTMARRFWAGQDPIGRQIQYGNMDGDVRLLHVVGVVGDVRDNGLDSEPRPVVYANYFQRPATASQFSIVARARGDAAALVSAMRREARALNPEMPTKFETVKEIVSASLDNRRFSMVMLGVFAGSALILAMVGLYGVMAYITSQRTHEIGIRMALGAQRIDMLRMIFRQSFALVLAGMVVGILGSIAVTRLLSTMLYGVRATDVMTYLGVIGLLVAAAALASYIPARRAMKVDPMVALRYE